MGCRCILTEAQQILYFLSLYTVGFLLFISRFSRTNYAALKAPAQDVLEYEVVKFNNWFDANETVFQNPPSAELDAAWEGLYSCEMCFLYPSLYSNTTDMR